jgi:hypothetical protein
MLSFLRNYFWHQKLLIPDHPVSFVEFSRATVNQKIIIISNKHQFHQARTSAIPDKYRQPEVVQGSKNYNRKEN